MRIDFSFIVLLFIFFSDVFAQEGHFGLEAGGNINSIFGDREIHIKGTNVSYSYTHFPQFNYHFGAMFNYRSYGVAGFHAGMTWFRRGMIMKNIADSFLVLNYNRQRITYTYADFPVYFTLYLNNFFLELGGKPSFVFYTFTIRYMNDFKIEQLPVWTLNTFSLIPSVRFQFAIGQNLIRPYIGFDFVRYDRTNKTTEYNFYFGMGS